ncbi:YdcH family protein [Helicobacter sp. MIT 14-3879]|uniref:YdcH family protein n=1 Tax=Helicobacter sp. MIT 14-3879 TaxID=2040649 RepID=UPI000E1EB979|nr:DUF465 domain-containing protein [Helicobacter sp. MIT 14-3879]RDU65049.1 hypothetical protein CQA44_01695 [Helicobacter sp. MIT 14-3879]
MLHEYREEINELKAKNPHFAKIFEEHNDLDDKIKEVESGGGEYVGEFELETMKKKKLKLKDEAYMIILEYKKNKNK